MKQIVWTVLIVTVVAFTCLVCYGAYNLTNRIINSPSVKKILTIKEVKIDTVFTVQKFCLELQIQHVLYPEIVLRQACLESGFFTSNIWKKYNNPFGFCFKDAYLQFDDYKDAIRYYKGWQTRWFMNNEDIDSKETYYQFLEGINYSEDSLYIEKLKNIDLSKLK